MPDDNIFSNIGSDLSTAGQGVTHVLSNPLVQGALATYLGAISSPRRLGWGGAIGRGGLAGLNTFGQAERLQEQLPMMQAETGLAQAELQQKRAQLRPLSKDEVDQLNRLKASAIDPLTGKPDQYHQQLIGSMESWLRGGRMTPAEFSSAIKSIDEARSASELMKAQASMMGAEVMPEILHQYFPNVQASNTSAQPPAAPTNTPVPSSVPAEPASAGAGNVGVWADKASRSPDGKMYFHSKQDGKWHQMNPDGTPGPAIS